MKYLLDAVVILIFLLSILIGHKRGFIKTVAGIVALVAALAVSSLLCGPVSEFVYDKTIEPALTEVVAEQVEQAQGNAIEQLDSAYQSLPTFVKNLLAQAGVEDVDDLAQTIPMGTNIPISESVNAVIRPVLLPLLRAICSLVLFFITYVIASILLRVLNLVAKLPLLKQLNKTLGSIGGVVSGMLWVLIAVTVIQILAATAAADGAITLQTISETTVVNWLSGINPLGDALLDIILV